MELYLLRHGIAADLGAPGCRKDADRPLTPEGRKKLKDVTAAMAALELEFDVILSSPYVRAQETAEIVAHELARQSQLAFCEHLVPGGNARKLVEFVQKLIPAPTSLLLVGHEPMLSGLISFLVFGSARGLITMKKAGLCKLSIEELKPGACATLEWLLTPRLMGRMK